MKKILIVEDEFIEATNLERMLVKAEFEVCGIARSVPNAISIIEKTTPDFVLLDISLRGEQTGIDLARLLRQQNIPFLYLSANTNKSTLEAAKATRPYGFLVKPFREKDVLIMLDIALYQHNNGLESLMRNQPATPTIKGECDTAHAIIGQSEELKEVLKHLHIVAPTETTVLIAGESGTGKEMIAHAVHHVSPRRNQPFIKVNCAAMPYTLIESILFGHEKGAFTGATARNIGKFEQASGGTLFLDEIGEIPMDIQVKFLRALQEKEIERLGGKDSIKVNVRVIAATNRDLEKEMLEGRFRLDLYYRLNVFPLHLPPLRQRKKDIPLLANHFIEKFSKAEQKNPFQLTPQLTERLMAYHWPGNIRELENIMNRMVLLNQDNKTELLHLLPVETPTTSTNDGTNSSPVNNEDIKTWQEYERAYIIYALKKCNGKISGENGAAGFLNLPPTTLESKMKRLGIKKSDYANA